MSFNPSINRYEHPIKPLKAMRKYPDNLYVAGNTALLECTKIAIVGTRKPTPYTKRYTFEVAQKLSNAGLCIVSGAAMGVDAIAHQGAGSSNTIAVMGNGLDIRYPAVNRQLIESIEREGLCISPFDPGFKPTKWSFVVRNEIVAALGDALLVMQADLDSGSLRSVEFARRMGKPVYVLPHRLDESPGTNLLLERSEAEAIYDIDRFVRQFDSKEAVRTGDPVLEFCKTSPTYEKAVEAFGEKIFEYELDGKLVISDGQVRLV